MRVVTAPFVAFNDWMSLRISRKIFLALIALTSVVTVISCLGLYALARNALDRSLKSRLRHVAITTALLVDGDLVASVHTVSDAHRPAWNAVAERLSRARDENGLRYVYTMRRGRPGFAEFVVDPSPNNPAPVGKEYDLSLAPDMAAGFDKPSVDADIVRDEDGASLSGYAPITTRDGVKVGLVGIDMDASEVFAARRKFALLTFGLFSLFTLIAVGASLWAAQVLTKPILDMTEQVRAISAGDLDRRMKVPGRDEVSQLSSAVNRMLETLSRYLPVAVVAKILGSTKSLDLGGVRAPATVFFSDVADFTSISEKLTPEEVVTLMNEYLSAMTDVIELTGGTVDKYLGDAIMAFWGAPEPQPDHALRACEAALAQIAALAPLQEHWRVTGKPPLAFRIGLNSGDVVVGNMGSTRRFNYTVMGDVVNLASRLEGANKNYGTVTLIGETVVQQASGAFEFRRLDRLRVKGKAKAVEVYELLERKGNVPPARLAARDAFEQALAAYFARDWDAAEAALARAAELRPGDLAVETFRKRIAELRVAPPPSGWDGSYEMQTK